MRPTMVQMQERLLEKQWLQSIDTKSLQFYLLNYLRWANGDADARCQVQKVTCQPLIVGQLPITNLRKESQALQKEVTAEAKLVQEIQLK